MLFPKQNNWRNKKYLEWVKTQESVVSFQPADDPHHIKGHGMGGGIKAPDWAVIPLTREEHNQLHHIGHLEWERLYGCQLEHLFRFWLSNFEEIKEFL